MSSMAGSDLKFSEDGLDWDFKGHGAGFVKHLNMQLFSVLRGDEVFKITAA